MWWKSTSRMQRTGSCTGSTRLLYLVHWVQSGSSFGVLEMNPSFSVRRWCTTIQLLPVFVDKSHICCPAQSRSSVAAVNAVLLMSVDSRADHSASTSSVIASKRSWSSLWAAGPLAPPTHGTFSQGACHCYGIQLCVLSPQSRSLVAAAYSVSAV
jgi:hypothetical protein